MQEPQQWMVQSQVYQHLLMDCIDANGDLDVDGHTNLDNVSVAGVSTFTGDVHLVVSINWWNIKFEDVTNVDSMVY